MAYPRHSVKTVRHTDAKTVNVTLNTSASGLSPRKATGVERCHRCGVIDLDAMERSDRRLLRGLGMGI